MKLVHVLASLNIAAGGPPQAVRDLTAALTDQGVTNAVVATADVRLDMVEFDRRVRVLRCGRIARDSFGMSSAPGFLGPFRSEIESADLVHIHELWHVPQALGSFICEINEVPYVISPHGELADWSLRQKRFLKQLAWLGYERHVLRSASAIHALTQDECAAVLAQKVGAKVRVIPNGIDIARVQALIGSTTVRGDNRGLPSKFILHVGRLHQKKGVWFILNVFSQLADEVADLDLLIVGPDPQGMWGKLSAMTRELGISTRVHYLGVVDESTKLRLIQSAELVVLPSFSEGLSMVMLEALACATPLVVSPNCGLPEVQERGAGKIVPLDIKSFVQAILEVVTNRELRNIMSRHAFALAEQEFQSARVAARMARFYAETLGG